MLALSYIMVFRTDQAHLVIEAMESLSMIWAVGLSVLGIYVYKRSEDKKALSAFQDLSARAVQHATGLSPVSNGTEEADDSRAPRYNE